MLACILLAILLMLLCLNHFALQLRLSFAGDQITIINAAREEALRASTPVKATSFLEYLVNYYPSGTKQVQGSKLDRIVETARSNAVAVIIEDLRKRTGQDYGNNPTNWYSHYPPERP